MARFEFKLPDIGEGIAEAEIVAWHVKVGDEVKEDQQLADMMTDKATVEMESPVAGRVTALAGEVGQMVPIGSVLVVLETEATGEAEAEKAEAEEPTGPRQDGIALADGYVTADPDMARSEPSLSESEAPAKSAPATPVVSVTDAPPGRPVLAAPAVRQRARDLGIDLAQVRTAGERIRHADLDAYLMYNGGAVSARPAPRRVDEQVKIVGLRRKIAENMQAAKRQIPHFAYVEEVDVTALEATRLMMNADRSDNPKLTLLPFLITALCRALTDFPQINARYDDEANVVTRCGSVHMGMATQTEHGLAVPVIRDADQRDLWELAREILRLADAARSGKASREELNGSTITISSLGPMGGIVSTPVINRPEVAIVAVNKVMERPVVVDGRVEIRKVMNLSSSFDHRVVDGWDAASFIQAVKGLLERPLRLLSLH